MQQIDWSKLGFEFTPTRSNIRFHYANGQWDEGKLTSDYSINISVAANVLHYGQAIFEGMKAFRGKDGKVRLFRPDANAKRLNSSARQLVMPEFPVDKFVEAVRTVVKDNIDYVPPYGTGGSLYIRPVMFGTSPQIGVNASLEYELVIMVMPVGAYYKGGIKPVRAVIYDEYDRAAPQGMGDVKVGGNYAASLYAHEKAKKDGWPVELYLDAKEHKYVEEFSTSNFLGIKADGTYVTPDSCSVLPSITNMSLKQCAKDLGIKVECRPVPYTEIKKFDAVAALGTAVVITPVWEITRGKNVVKISDPETVHPVLQKLYDRVQGIQYGTIADKHGWCFEVK